MKTFNKKLKDTLLKEIKNHRKLDKITQGSYGGANGPWCAVGCAIHSLNVKLGKNYKTGDHSVYETELGIPRILARLEDRIFEGLDSKEAKTFPEKFIQAVPVGVDLSLVWPKFAVWLLTDKKHGVIKCAKNTKTSDAITKVGKLYTRVVDGGIVSIVEWREARKAAYTAYAAYVAAAYAAAYAAYAAYDADAAYVAAAYAAAYAAYDADAAYAAYADAAYAAYAAAAYDADAAAAYTADADAAYTAARRKHYSVMAAKLIEIIKETK